MLLYFARPCIIIDQNYQDTSEGFEYAFALNYQSRFALSYRLKESLENSDNPITINVGGSGMNGKVSWDDLQDKRDFNSLKTQYHCNRINDFVRGCISEMTAKNKILSL